MKITNKDEAFLLFVLPGSLCQSQNGIMYLRANVTHKQ